MKAALVCLTAILLGCCGCTPTPAKTATTETSKMDNSSPFSLTASSEGTFLLNQGTGKIWKYDQKENAFLEVPVTSKIIKWSELEPNAEKK